MILYTNTYIMYWMSLAILFLTWTIIIFTILVFIHSPILKPWFGFRKPKGHPGRWFQ